MEYDTTLSWRDNYVAYITYTTDDVVGGKNKFQLSQQLLDSTGILTERDLKRWARANDFERDDGSIDVDYKMLRMLVRRAFREQI